MPTKAAYARIKADPVRWAKYMANVRAWQKAHPDTFLPMNRARVKKWAAEHPEIMRAKNLRYQKIRRACIREGKEMLSAGLDPFMVVGILHERHGRGIENIKRWLGL